MTVLYGRSLGSPFVYDDLDQVVNNPNLGDWSRFAHRFLLHPVSLTTSLLGNAGSTYRPVFWLSLFLDRQIWGAAPFGFHLTNLLLHGANGCLAFLLLRRLRLPLWPAFAVGLIWLSLPVNTEVVAWVSGRAYLLCTSFVLATLLSALSFLRRGRPAWAGLCFLAAGCAVLSHELGVVVLPLLLLIGVGSPSAARVRRFTPVLAGAMAVLVAEAWRLHLGVRAFTGLANLRWALLALSQYLELIAFPLHMSLERSTSMTLGRLSPVSLLALGCLAIGFGCALWRRSSLPWLAGGLLWFALCIAPFCLVENYQGLAERFVYLAGLGLVVAVVVICLQPLRPGLRSTSLSILGLWCFWNLCRTSVRVGDWTDPVRLYEASLGATPQSPSLHYNLAFSLRERGNLSGALTEYQRTLDLDPRFPNGYASLGDVYLKQDRYAEAQAAYIKALAIVPDDPAVLLNVGAAYQGAGDAAKAEQAYLRVLQVDAKNSAAHVNLGVLYVGEQHADAAMHQFAMAIDLKTRDIVPYYDLGALFQQAGRPDLALVLYKRVLELKPDDPDTLRNMAILQGTR